MFSQLIRGLLGMLGIIKKTVVYKASDFAEFVRSLEPATIIVMGKFIQDAFSDGIKAGTNSAYSHTLHYTGMNGGGTGKLHEIVEAIAEGICVQTLDKYNSKDCYMVAFTFDLTPREYEIIKHRIYSRVGEAYDFQGIAHQAFPFIPDNPHLEYCSSLIAKSFQLPEMIRKILPKKDGKEIDPNEATPGDVYNGCFPQVIKCKIAKFNC